MRTSSDIDTPTLRAAMVAIRMFSERPAWTPTTAEIADYLGMGHSGAFRLMARLARVLPIAQDEEERWRRVGH